MMYSWCILCDTERERERERASGASLSAHHFGNLRSCSPIWRGAHLPGLCGCELQSGRFNRIIRLIGSCHTAIHWLLSSIPLMTVMILFLFLSPAVSKWAPAASAFLPHPPFFVQVLYFSFLCAVVWAGRGGQYVILVQMLRGFFLPEKWTTSQLGFLVV